MKMIDNATAHSLLCEIKMVIGSWNEIADIDATKSWANYCAPNDARQLFNFAQHVVGWLPIGPWMILHIDNSTSFDLSESSFISNLAFGASHFHAGSAGRTYLFEIDRDSSGNHSQLLALANFVFAFLLFGGHCYVASAGSVHGERIGVQDGYVYFSSRTNDVDSAHVLIREFEAAPLRSPSWVLKFEEETGT